MGLPSPSRETKFSGTNAEREIFIFPVQLTTCRTGNFTGLIHTLDICLTIHTYIVIYEMVNANCRYLSAFMRRSGIGGNVQMTGSCGSCT